MAPGFGYLLILVIAALFAWTARFPPLAWFGIGQGGDGGVTAQQTQ